MTRGVILITVLALVALVTVVVVKRDSILYFPLSNSVNNDAIVPVRAAVLSDDQAHQPGALAPSRSPRVAPSTTPILFYDSLPTRSRSPWPTNGCRTVPRGPVKKVNGKTQGFLLVLYSVTRNDRNPFFEKRMWAEFARLVVRLREFHPNIGIAAVVDDLSELWFNGTQVDGGPDVHCAYGYNIYSLVDVVINAQRHPRTAATWMRGQHYTGEHILSSAGTIFALHTVAWHLTPWDHTIFFDNDVMPCKPVDGLFNLLDRFDAALVPDPYRAAGMRMPVELNDFSDAFNLVNLGTFVYDYRKEAVRCLISETFEILVAGLPPDLGSKKRRAFATDQEPFMGALWTCRDAKIWMLQDEWICFQKTTCNATADLAGRIPCNVIHTHALYALPEFKAAHWRNW